MKAIIKNQIRLAIVIACVFSFVVPSAVFASLNTSEPAEKFDSYDFFPDYHREAQKKEEVLKEKAKGNIVDNLVTDAEWVGGTVYAPVAVVTGEYGGFTDKIIVPYEVISGDYVALIERVLSKYGSDIAEAADALLSMKL